MDERQSLEAFGALSQETRLRIVRLLVQAGPGGMAAGAIGEAVGASSSNASFHLAQLERAGLIRSRREARSIIYSADLDGLAGLLRFLMEDCCRGNPQICMPALQSLTTPEPANRRPPMADRPYNVLFLCTGNTARSILAEGLLRKDGAGRFNAYSAGSQPKGVVNPFALKVLDALGYPADGFRSKSWSEFARPGAPVMDFVFTVCDSAAGEACPLWPGQPMTAHWGIEDPAAVEGSDIEKERAFVQAAKYLKNRISAFLSLPLASIDELSLQHRLREIGHQPGGTSPRPEVA